MKGMSEINLSDVDDFFEDEDIPDGMDHEDRVSRKWKKHSRRKTEYLLELRKLREMLSTDDNYRGN
jgi:hypothetical protein